MRILLFDIDGVLLKPYGYRKAYFETCRWLIDEGKLNINLPADEIPALFESYGVTCEWDMLSITASIMLQEIIDKNRITLESKNFAQALSELAAIDKTEQEIDFRQHIQALSVTFHLHEIPSIGVLQSGKEFLTNVPDVLIDDIFEDTRNLEKTLITHIFQNLVLGTETFEETYPLKALINCDSYLRKYDVSLLSERCKTELVQQKGSENILFAALTARPSLQPRDTHADGCVLYSPEAESALDVIGMQEMPLIGYGRLQYIEQIIGISADVLIKPDSFHALAAIFSLLGNSETLGLQAAGEIRKSNQIPDWVQQKIDGPLSICVFEDSQGGIRSVVSAAKQLNQLGIKTEIKLYGITRNKDKEQTLRGLNAMIFPDINSALKSELNL